MRRVFVPAITICLLTLSIGCDYGDPVTFDEPFWVVGGSIDEATLNRGQEAYTRYCYACHGEGGDGNGPASYALRPPPRDFRNGLMKFAGVVEGDGLARDEDLHRIIKHGLNGTAMLPWDIPDTVIYDIIHYIKTFSLEEEGYRDVEAEIHPVFEWSEDNWVGKEDAAREMGSRVYHGKAKCWTCHASMVDRDGVIAAVKSYGQDGSDVPTDGELFQPKLQDSKYTLRLRHPVHTRGSGIICKQDSDCDQEKGHFCDMSYAVRHVGPKTYTDPEGDNGRCALKVQYLPPDFSINTVRSYRPPTPDEFTTYAAAKEALSVAEKALEKAEEGDDETATAAATETVKGAGDAYATAKDAVNRGRKDLYRTLAHGLAGTAMNGWKGVLTEDEIWALSYYVESLIERKDTNTAWKHKANLQASATD